MAAQVTLAPHWRLAFALSLRILVVVRFLPLHMQRGGEAALDVGPVLGGDACESGYSPQAELARAFFRAHTMRVSNLLTRATVADLVSNWVLFNDEDAVYFRVRHARRHMYFDDIPRGVAAPRLHATTPTFVAAKDKCSPLQTLLRCRGPYPHHVLIPNLSEPGKGDPEQFLFRSEVPERREVVGDLLAGCVEPDNDGIAEGLKHIIEPTPAGEKKDERHDDSGDDGTNVLQRDLLSWTTVNNEEPWTGCNANAKNEREDPEESYAKHADQHRRRSHELAREGDAQDVLLYLQPFRCIRCVDQHRRRSHELAREGDAPSAQDVLGRCISASDWILLHTRNSCFWIVPRRHARAGVVPVRLPRRFVNVLGDGRSSTICGDK